MIRRLFSNMPAMYSCTMPTSGMSRIISITRWLAPPCSEPLSAPSAPEIAECISLSVLAMTRAVKVLALSS